MLRTPMQCSLSSTENMGSVFLMQFLCVDVRFKGHVTSGDRVNAERVARASAAWHTEPPCMPRLAKCVLLAMPSAGLETWKSNSQIQCQREKTYRRGAGTIASALQLLDEGGAPGTLQPGVQFGSGSSSKNPQVRPFQSPAQAGPQPLPPPPPFGPVHF